MTLFQVDAFTDTPFRGNPAGVCILEQPADEAWMQEVACEMNLAETAFLTKEVDGYRLRWFTPTMEVDLCGHATLASAHVLWERGFLPGTRDARFHTKSGLLKAVRRGELIELDFPTEAPAPVKAPSDLARALGVEPTYVGKNRMDYLVEIADAKALRKLDPDLTALRRIPGRGFIVTAASDDPRYDFISRFFAPAAGVDEDPVTGSAHCCLGPYWAERLAKTELNAYQASPRGGSLVVRVAGDRTYLLGRAITVMSIRLLTTG
ncbi:MAG: PhzF family phenazine biosynthesis protein [Rhodothermales bacterium]|nr:PhzF family phenazine biosynthesis protein [Rhodothermales bacterium]